MTMATFYNVSNKFHEGNLFSMFTSVAMEIWIGYVTSFFLFVTIFYLGSALLKQKYSSLWNTTCAFLDQDNFPTSSNFFIFYRSLSC